MYRKSAMAIVVILSLLASGCVLNKNGVVDPAQQRKDIYFFVKTATIIVLHETKPTIRDIQILKTYLIAGTNLLNENSSNLQGLKDLVLEVLPERYHIFGLTVVDVIKRYVHAHMTNPNQDIIQRNLLIRSGLMGAFDAVNEYVSAT